MNAYIKFFFKSALTVIFLASCLPTTTITGMWENYEVENRPIDTVAVFVLREDQAIRKRVESELVGQIQANGAKAFTGHLLMGSHKTLAKFALLETLKKQDIHYALVLRSFTRGADLKHPRAIEVPRDYQDFYARISRSSYEPTAQEYINNYQNISTEASLYDIVNETIIFSLITDTIKKGDEEQLIHDFSREIIEYMTERNLLLGN